MAQRKILRSPGLTSPFVLTYHLNQRTNYNVLTVWRCRYVRASTLHHLRIL